MQQIEEIEACEACHRLVDISRLVKTLLGYYICEDQEECIAAFSGWNKPAEARKLEGK